MKFSRRGFILPMIYKKTNIFENEDTYIFFCRSSQLSSTLHPTGKEKRFFHFPPVNRIFVGVHKIPRFTKNITFPVSYTHLTLPTSDLV